MDSAALLPALPWLDVTVHPEPGYSATTNLVNHTVIGDPNSISPVETALETVRIPTPSLGKIVLPLWSEFEGSQCGHVLAAPLYDDDTSSDHQMQVVQGGAGRSSPTVPVFEHPFVCSSGLIVSTFRSPCRIYPTVFVNPSRVRGGLVVLNKMGCGLRSVQTVGLRGSMWATNRRSCQDHSTVLLLDWCHVDQLNARRWTFGVCRWFARTIFGRVESAVI